MALESNAKTKKNNLEGYYIVSKDDFVYNPRISASAPVGPIKRNKLQKGVMSPLYSIFRFKESLLEYFEHYFETTNWHKYLHSVANFGARHDRMNITNSDFSYSTICTPEIEKTIIHNVDFTKSYIYFADFSRNQHKIKFFRKLLKIQD